MRIHRAREGLRASKLVVLLVVCGAWRAAQAAGLRSGGAVLAPTEEEGIAEPPPLSDAAKAAILQRLRDRKNALNRLALEDALGKETEEQAKSESSVLSTMGGAPFLGVDEQKAKLSVSDCGA